MPDLTRDQLTDICKRARVVYEDEMRLFGLETVNSFAITGGVVRAVVEALEGAGYRVEVKPPKYAVPEIAVGFSPEFREAARRIRGIIEEAERRTNHNAAEDGPEPTKPADPGDDDKSFLGGPLPTPEELESWGEPQPPEPAPGSAAAFLTAREEIDGALDDVTDADVRAWRGHEPEPTADDNTAGMSWTDAQRELFGRFAIAVKHMARDGYMPTQVEYDADKPTDLPGRIMLCRKLSCTWTELAAMLGLKVQPRGGRPDRGKAAEREPHEHRYVANPHKHGPVPDTPPKTVPPLRGTLILGDDGLAKEVVGAASGETLAQRNERVYGEPVSGDGALCSACVKEQEL